MSQAAILAIVAEKPGPLQLDIPQLTGLKEQSIGTSIKGLMKWGRIRRERVRLNDKRSWTYALFLVTP